ncbi:unnamed protein product [Urochloa humidicola]
MEKEIKEKWNTRNLRTNHGYSSNSSFDYNDYYAYYAMYTLIVNRNTETNVPIELSMKVPSYMQLE